MRMSLADGVGAPIFDECVSVILRGHPRADEEWFSDDDAAGGAEEEWRFNVSGLYGFRVSYPDALLLQTMRSRMSMNMDEASDLLGERCH